MRDFWRKLWQKYPEMKKSIVYLKTNSSFRGIIWSVDSQFLVMKNTEMLKNDGVKVLDGDVLIQRNDIEFIQVP
jgi:small nuclear ribonucleoprotein (snRNP)-like protein